MAIDPRFARYASEIARLTNELDWAAVHTQISSFQTEFQKLDAPKKNEVLSVLSYITPVIPMVMFAAMQRARDKDAEQSVIVLNEMGFSFDFTDANSNNALHAAIKGESAALIRLLIAQQAPLLKDSNITPEEALLNCPNADGITPLDLAMELAEDCKGPFQDSSFFHLLTVLQQHNLSTHIPSSDLAAPAAKSALRKREKLLQLAAKWYTKISAEGAASSKPVLEKLISDLMRTADASMKERIINDSVPVLIYQLKLLPTLGFSSDTLLQFSHNLLLKIVEQSSDATLIREAVQAFPRLYFSSPPPNTTLISLEKSALRLAFSKGTEGGRLLQRNFSLLLQMITVRQGVAAHNDFLALTNKDGQTLLSFMSKTAAKWSHSLKPGRKEHWAPELWQTIFTIIEQHCPDKHDYQIEEKVA